MKALQKKVMSCSMCLIVYMGNIHPELVEGWFDRLTMNGFNNYLIAPRMSSLS